MDRFSTRLATSVIADQHRAAAAARRASLVQAPDGGAPAQRTASAPARIMLQLSRPFGFRSATR